ncbi:MAG: cytochrome c oxidase assembly protein, partial [bacterium]
MVAPPLLWLGAPALALLRGLPARAVKRGLGPFLTWPALQRLGSALAHPGLGWIALNVAVGAWHLPGPYQLALRAPGWHELEHASFLIAGLWFWFPVVQPFPSRPRWPRWAMIPYLLSADVLNTLLAALFTFAAHPLYAAYAAAPALTSGGALGDQAMAGALMWVAGSAAYLIAAGAIVIELLSPVGRVDALRRSAPAEFHWTSPATKHAGTVASGRVGFDLLRVPFLGAAARTLTTRRALQTVMLLLAAAVVLDGFFGPQMGPMNLAGVLPWTYWRGGVVIALLVVGNLFCAVCPFMLPRELGKRWFAAQRVWPRWLRGKWLALGLLATYLWAYEAFDLWDRPAATAAIVLGYFAAAFAVDAVFRGASFCKHVCPIGQFHFVHAGVAPFDLQARDASVCRGCTTHDCLRGGAGGRGCELDLFVPEKRGSLDCTLCLDCVRACPHDNVGLIVGRPGRALPFAGRARLVERFDVAALALLCVAGAFANAAGMLAPVLAGEQALASSIGLGSPLLITTAFLLCGLLLAPATAAALATWSSRAAARLGGAAAPAARAIFTRFAIALVPLGFGMWSAHFLFHFLAGIGTLPPVVQRIAVELGTPLFGQPAWASMGAPRSEWLTGLELLLLDAGLLLTVAVGWRTALDLAGSGAAGRARRALRLAVPWAMLALALWSLGVWIVFQPMQMRGMVH